MPKRELTKHNTGQWKKKIRGRVYYFGTDYHDALRRYHAMMAGVAPSRKPVVGPLTVHRLVDLWMETQGTRASLGRIAAVTLSQYGEVARRLKDMVVSDAVIGEMEPSVWSRMLAHVAKEWGIHRQKTFVTNVRSIFRWGHENGLCEMPRFGTEFVPPPQSVYREARRRGDRVMTGETVRKLLAASDGYLYPAILLGINCGYGNQDVSVLEWKDIRDGVIDVLRHKTKVRRVCPLWPETLEALPQRKEGPILRTSRGTPVGRKNGSDPLAMGFIKLCRTLGLPYSFYDLRHTFRTVADSWPDTAAVDMVMGHETRTVGATYYVGEREIRRARDVVDHVRSRLWPDGRGPLGS